MRRSSETRPSFGRKLLLGCLLVLLLPSSALAQSTDLERIVDLYRKILVLLDEASLRDDGGTLERVARSIYAEKERLVRRVEQRIQEPAGFTAFADYVSGEDLEPADRLAFADLMEAAERAPEARRDALRAQIDDTRRQFGSEVATGRRGAARPRWRAYLDRLRAGYAVDAILREFPLDPETGSRDGYGEHAVFGYGLPEKHVVLSFDDGPHPRFTDEILATLDEHGARAYFFTVGRNLGSLDGEGPPVLTRASLRTRLADAAGHVIANHSYSHPRMPKLSPEARARELEDTSLLVKALVGKSPELFRPPYGETNRELTEEYARKGFTSVLWNVDSWDWGDPIPESIATRVLERLDKARRGIVLFHDVHRQTVSALPLVLDGLESRGFEIATLDGAVTKPPVPLTSADEARAEPVRERSHRAKPFYRESWAVVVGINAYRSWPRLSFAVNDADAVASLLVERFGFKPENVFTLMDEEATRERIVELLGETLAAPERVHHDDRVFVFFAGHGATRKLPSGRALGYIVPVDAGYERYAVRSISMSQLGEFSELIPAKHVYFVMDSCYSGIALTRGGSASPYLDEVTSRTARQILTAGGANESVADGGPGGHSIFTWTLLQGLSGLADLDGNRILTATELGAFTAPIVSRFSSQTPAFGNLAGSEGGEFVFELEPEDLSSVSRQLDTEALVMSAELERLQRDLSVKLERNLALSREIEKLRQASGRSDEGRLAQANRHHALGLQYFRERRYDRALDELAGAFALNPGNATITNNYGYLLYRIGRLEESIEWFQKTIDLDPDRAVVWVNLGDALWELGRREEAREAYRRYLELWPSSPRRMEIGARVKP